MGELATAVAKQELADAEKEIRMLRGELGRALEHIEMVCGADWSAGDCDESDRAQSFVRHVRGLRPDLPRYIPAAT